MAGSNSLKLAITQSDGDDVLSVLTLEYPSITNAEANAIQLRYLAALTGAAGELAGEKAEAIGEGEVFGAMFGKLRDALGGVVGQVAQVVPPEIGRGILR